jgi:hypothetical protein
MEFGWWWRRPRLYHFAKSSVDVAGSSLGDPYNSDASWAELSRCVKRGGYVLFTTPAFEWASEYRRTAHYPIEESEFLLADGTEITLPSNQYA